MNKSTNLTSSDHHNDALMALGIFHLMLMFGICFGNGLVITAFRIYEPLKTVTNYFLVHLAIADMVVGLSLGYTVVSAFLPKEVYVKYNMLFCFLSGFLLSVPILVSLQLLLAVTVDRYIAIFWPLKYPLIVTIRKVHVAVLLIWIGTIIYVIIALIDWNYYSRSFNGDLFCIDFETGSIEPRMLGYTYAPLFCLILVIIICIYVRIFLTIKDKMGSKDGVTITSMKKNIAILKLAAIILGLFFTCWAPYIVCVTYIHTSVGTIASMDFAFLSTYSLTLVNSLLNPIIYALRSTEFRHGFKKALCIKDNATGCSTSLRLRDTPAS